jgi:thiamine biosynthesis lipoprotein
MRRLVAIAFAAVLATACQRDPDRLPEYVFSGEIMGTSFSVKIVATQELDDQEDLDREIRERLTTIDTTMSTYRPESELSVFNAEASTDWQPVSTALCQVVDGALEISDMTDGAFDITVGPLVNLWGFGPTKLVEEPPADGEISAALERSGYDKIAADCGRPALRKTRGDMYIDLSGYAKGHAVDVLAELLDEHGFEDYLVEIGGEIRVRGQNAAGADWAIAIEKPEAGSRSVQTIVRLTDVALATSGDYRNFFEVDGRRYSHTIDPATGRPVEHNAASVTVIDPSTARADGLATALLVMGPEDGLAFAEQNELAAYYLVRTDDRFEDRMTTRFTGLLH